MSSWRTSCGYLCIPVAAIALMLLSAQPARCRGRNEKDQKKDVRLSGKDLNAWKDQKEKQGFSKRDVDRAIKESGGNKDMMDFFLAKVKEKKYSSKDVAESYRLCRPKSRHDRYTSDHMDRIQAFWKHLVNPYAPTTFDEVANVYKNFPTRLDLHQLYFWYKYQSADKKPNPPVTPAELIAIIKAAKGVENDIAFYFKMRLDEKKPIKDCIEALKNKIKGIDPAEADKQAREKAAAKEKEMEKKGDAKDEKKADTEKKVEEKKPEDKKPKPKDDVLQFD